MVFPRISIVIPSLNQGKFITQTLDSIFDQNYPNTEIIVMDGGSTDGTKKIITDYGLRITNLKGKIRFMWESKKDKGQADAINKGLYKATGDILCYLNSDDYLLPDALTKAAAYFSTHEDCHWLTGDGVIVDEKGNEIHHYVRLYKRMLRLWPVRWILPVTNPIVQPSTFWRRVVTEKIGFFDQGLSYTFDYDYWLRLSRRFPLFISPSVFSVFRIHRSSKGGSSYKKQFKEEMNVVKSHVHNPVIRFLHELHNAMIVGVYDRIKPI